MRCEREPVPGFLVAHSRPGAVRMSGSELERCCACKLPASSWPQLTAFEAWEAIPLCPHVGMQLQSLGSESMVE